MTRSEDKSSLAANGGDLEERLAKLEKENRRLKRKLDKTTQLLVNTDELYRSSESVLTKAYADLEEIMAKYHEQSEELYRSSRLAAVGEMAGRVVHEVLNPLTGLLGNVSQAQRILKRPSEESALAIAQEIVHEWAEMLKSGDFEEYLQKKGKQGESLLHEDVTDLRDLLSDMREEKGRFTHELDVVERIVLRVTKIIDSMRGLSRTNSSVKEVDLNVVAETTIDLLKTQMAKAHIEVVKELNPVLPTVLADEGEMIQVLSNVVRNAAQAIAGKGKITISSCVKDGRVELRVKDTGGGLDESIQNADVIFESGFTTKSVSEGTGLGLGICRRFMRKYRGDIEVESSIPGEGLTMLLWCPETPEDACDEIAEKTGRPRRGRAHAGFSVASPGEAARALGAADAEAKSQRTTKDLDDDTIDRGLENLESAGELLHSPRIAGHDVTGTSDEPTFVPAKSRYAIDGEG